MRGSGNSQMEASLEGSGGDGGHSVAERGEGGLPEDALFGANDKATVGLVRWKTAQRWSQWSSGEGLATRTSLR